MGDIIPLRPSVADTNEDILPDIFAGLNQAAIHLGYEDDKVGWIDRLEPILDHEVHMAYLEYTDGDWG